MHVEIRNYSRFKRIFPNCFVASNAVDFLLNQVTLTLTLTLTLPRTHTYTHVHAHTRTYSYTYAPVSVLP